MNSFERELSYGIPLHEAADFFIKVKTAAWEDPPDDTGTLEGVFSVPPEQVLAKLRQVISVKFRMMLAYFTYAQTYRSHNWRGTKIEFYDHADEERAGAEFYLKRATTLGGPVQFDPIDPPPATTNPVSILQIMARAEQEAIQLQRELRQMVGDDNPMKVGIEEQLLRDQHHLDECWQMMEEGDTPRTPILGPAQEAPAAPMGAQPAPESEPTEQPAEEPKTAAKKDRTDEDLKELGRQRGVASMAAQSVKDRSRRGERFGDVVGKAVGAAGGAVAGRKAIGGKAGTIAGLAAGYSLGGKAGREVGKEKDLRKNAEARFKAAISKMAEDFVGSATEGAAMSSPTPETMPTNYLEAEMMGQEAQNSNESGYYRSQLESMRQAIASLQQQNADAMASASQAQEQVTQAGSQIQQATQQASMAQDEALRQAQLAANMRMGYQKLQQQVLQLASQSPEMLGGVPTDVPPGSGQSAALPQDQQQMAPDAGLGGASPEGPAGQASSPQAAPNAAPAGSGGPSGSGGQTAQAQSSGQGSGDRESSKPQATIKIGSMLDHPAPWAAAFGLHGLARSAKEVVEGPEQAQQRVQQLEQQEGGGFSHALALAKAKAEVAKREFASKQPLAHMALSTAGNAMGGSVVGPALMREMAKHKVIGMME